ncbi:MAG: hypothetical protein JNG90_03630 [Planctomycetaceae bacterium]|nr:hypothetical protein [Planctomycetaceae bacterium]
MGLYEAQKVRDLTALLNDNSIQSEIHSSIRESLSHSFAQLSAVAMTREDLVGYLRGAFRLIEDDAYFPQPSDDDFIIKWMLRLYDELTSESSQ